MTIEFVSPAATSYTFNGGATSSFTVNKPSNAVEGHVLVAVVSFWTSSQRTVSIPGWTARQTTFRNSGGDNFQLCLLTRTVGASDPSSWSGSLSGSGYLLVTNAVAYSGVQEIGASAKATAGATSSLSTGSVSNTVAGAWTVVGGSYFASSDSGTISSNETTRRVLATTVDPGDSSAVRGAIWDSDAVAVPTSGSTSRVVSRSSSWTLAGAAILLLEPSTGTPASGPLDAHLSPLSLAAAGEVHNDAAADVDLPSLSVAFEGYGQPPVNTGPVEVTLPPLGVDVAGAIPVLAEFAIELSLTASFVAETRKFGERVFEVEQDMSRLIIVPSRGVED